MTVVTIFATTTGRSQKVAEVLKSMVSGEVFNARELPLPPERTFDLLILISPSLGQGEMHPALKHVKPFIQKLNHSGIVALISLGDSKFHKKTLAGSLRKLEVFAQSLNLKVIGFTKALTDTEKQSPSCTDGHLAGLVIDVRTDMQVLNIKLFDWLAKTEQQLFIQIIENKTIQKKKYLGV